MASSTAIKGVPAPSPSNDDEVNRFGRLFGQQMLSQNYGAGTSAKKSPEAEKPNTQSFLPGLTIPRSDTATPDAAESFLANLAPPTPSASTPVDSPFSGVTMLAFGPEAGDWTEIISKKLLFKIPNDVLQTLSGLGHKEGPLFCMDNYQDYESMKRLKLWLENPKSEATVTPRTVINFYSFAVRIAFNQLRNDIVQNLINSFPKSPKATLELMKIYDKACEIHDEKLVSHLRELLKLNVKDLATTHKVAYTQLMKRFLTPTDPIGFFLLDNYIHGAPTDGDSQPPTRPTPLSPQVPIQPDDPNGFYHALAGTYYAITNDEGYGTRVKQGHSSRNTDFTFDCGEVLLVLDEPAANGRRNKVVFNSKGWKGDIISSKIVFIQDKFTSVPSKYFKHLIVHVY
jgi:hypothetical protein